MNKSVPNHDSDTPKVVSIKISCNIQDDIKELFLIFKKEDEKSWYKVKMSNADKSYSVILPNIKEGLKIIYLFKAITNEGREILENNNGKLYTQIASKPTQKSKPEKEIGPILTESKQNTNSLKEEQTLPPDFASKISPFLKPTQELKTARKNAIKRSQKEPNQPNHSKKEIRSQNSVEDSANTNIISTSPISGSSQHYYKPIIAYNPFPADLGEIKIQSDRFSIFSENVEMIVSGHNDSTNDKKSRQPSVITLCKQCGMKMDPDWLICPVCGLKTK